MQRRGPRILVIRRDNIGDLLCTTPLLSALRTTHPDAWIGVLANSYNAPVLAGNPDIDAVFAYDKGKHLDSAAARLAALGRRLGLALALRRRRFDAAILAGGGQASERRFARWSGAREVVEPASTPEGMHEVERVFLRAGAWVAGARPGVMTLRPAPALMQSLRAELARRLPGAGPVLGLHISARKPGQRWPADRFIDLARRLHERFGARMALFWSPGAADDAKHPGDDDKAEEIARALAGLPVWPLATHRLDELIAGLNLCDRVICSDGGAMHVAAALGKPMVCFFGDTDARCWHPWGVPYRLLQPPSGRVDAIGAEEALDAYSALESVLEAALARS